jgi:site-specific DNA-methyltransferase (adenine-specific)
MTYKILKGNSLDLLPTLADNSIDAIVTDPPYGLGNPDPDYIIKAIQQWASGDRSHIPEGKGFMGKSWDSFVPPPAIWDECLRVLKPGGHLLAFAGTRTYDLMGISIRMAGFEIRDSIGWVYGSGFPKSLDVSKAIDKAAGAERKSNYQPNNQNNVFGSGMGGGKTTYSEPPSTPEAKQWQGWGTALKPAVEPIVVARKPLIGTVAENVLTHGTGGLNIDASRIGSDITKDPNYRPNAKNHTGHGSSFSIGGENTRDKKDLPDAGFHNSQGRWPANLILDEYTAELLDEQSGITKSSIGAKQTPNLGLHSFGKGSGTENIVGHNDSGGASRFFYVAKASKRDRNEGLEDLPAKNNSDWPQSLDGNDSRGAEPRQNFHPTVKPTELMRYLVRLITPPGGTVLDPFTGSGSTGKAAILEGFDFIGIELTEDYWPIIEGRLKHAEAKVAERIKETFDQEQEKLF